MKKPVSKKQHDLEMDDNQNVDESIAEVEAERLEDLGTGGETRREFLGQVSGAGFGILAMEFLTEPNAFATSETVGTSPLRAETNTVAVKLRINGAEQSLALDSRVTLLDALRERLALTGSKKGCDHGQCGACTVLVDGRRVLSCLTLTAQCEGKSVTTIEGLAHGDQLHPMQAAFIKHDGFQCGYCTPGQICSAVALMQEAKNGEASYVTEDVRSKTRAVHLSDDEIRERMSGNICRCGAYPNIIAAIREVHSGKEVAQTWQFAEESHEVVFGMTEQANKEGVSHETV